jgi:hypothetical protein
VPVKLFSPVFKLRANAGNDEDAMSTTRRLPFAIRIALIGNPLAP